MADHDKPITTEYQIVIKMNGYWESCMKDIVHTARTNYNHKKHHNTYMSNEPNCKRTFIHWHWCVDTENYI